MNVIHIIHNTQPCIRAVAVLSLLMVVVYFISVHVLQYKLLLLLPLFCCQLFPLFTFDTVNG